MNDNSKEQASKESKDDENIIDSKIEEKEGEKYSVEEEKLEDSFASALNLENDTIGINSKEVNEDENSFIEKEEGRIKRENESSSDSRWRKRDGVCPDQSSFKKHFSNTRNKSDVKNWRDKGPADGGCRRPVNVPNWRNKGVDSDLPSKVMDRDCLFYPSQSFIQNLSPKAGKWMLFGNQDYAKMDEYWEKVKRVCEGNEMPALVAVKTSTRKDERQGVIRAYTTDFTNKEEVKMVGMKILETTGYGGSIFYKTNEASRMGMYHCEGKTKVSRYKLDKFIFYERDEENKFIECM